MKTSLAIVLATIALTFGTMLSFTSGVAAQIEAGRYRLAGFGPPR